MSSTPTLNPAALLESQGHRLVLTASLRPVGGTDRFQPAGFPEVGHVLYDAPPSRHKEGKPEKICIVDSAPSMANHLETVCLRGPHDPDLLPALEGLPYVRCVTGADKKQVVVTTLTEGHRLASSYFLTGARVRNGAPAKDKFETELLAQFGFRDLKKKSHPLPEHWWNVFRVIFNYDPNSLIHGILFPQWSIKIPRLLTAVHEAFGAARVSSSGVKFDKLGKTTSGQPIFSKDEETAREIRATFIFDLSLLRSLGRIDGHEERGLTNDQKTLLLALSLWKVGQLLRAPFRYRSNCDLALDLDGLTAAVDNQAPAKVSAEHLASQDMKSLIAKAKFTQGITDVYWPEEELYKEPAKSAAAAPDEDEDEKHAGNQD